MLIREDIPKTLNGKKRLATEIIKDAINLLTKLNLNDPKLDIILFKSLVTTIAVNANELVILASSITKEN